MSESETNENKANSPSALEPKEPVKDYKFKQPTIPELLERSQTRKFEILDPSIKQKSSSQTTLELLMSQKNSSTNDTESSGILNLRFHGISSWMAKPRMDAQLSITEGLEYLQSLRKLYIYGHIQIIDKLFDEQNCSENCFTIRNPDLQKIYYVGSAHNRSLGKIRAFSLRVLDQYSTHVITIRKHCNCFALQDIDIYCPPNTLIGNIKQRRHKWNNLMEYRIFVPNVTAPKFIIIREKIETENTIKYDFNITRPNSTSIGKIAKRYEQISDKKNNFLFDDHYVRVTISENLTCVDKALLLSAGLLMNIFYLRKE